MSETGNVMNALKTALAAACPARVVTRELRDFNDKPRADLLAGVYTLIAGDEGNFPNYRGREGNFGDLQVALIAQIEVAENASAEDLEEAESTMIDEIKAFTRTALAAPIDSIVITALKRSQQLEHPYGWVLFDIEAMLQ